MCCGYKNYVPLGDTGGYCSHYFQASVGEGNERFKKVEKEVFEFLGGFNEANVYFEFFKSKQEVEPFVAQNTPNSSFLPSFLPLLSPTPIPPSFPFLPSFFC